MVQAMRNRRELLALAAAPLFGQGPGLLVSGRPRAPHGTMTGDVTPQSATIWSCADRPSRMRAAWWSSASGPRHSFPGPVCLPGSAFTGRVRLGNLPPGETIQYEVQFEDLDNPRAVSEPVRGRFQTPRASHVRFCWSGDTCGQGWGINRGWGGLRIYETIRQTAPDFFLHCGDTIYADGPLPAAQALPDGGVWRNLVTPEKSKVAETLDEFRGNYRYNLLDEHLRRFHAEISQIWQWDDHEVTNNWSPGKELRDDPRYREKDIRTLARRARQAFFEFAPLGAEALAAGRVYRRIPYGPLLDVFVIDLRSYRGPNTGNRQTRPGAETALLGRAQTDWLIGELRRSRALWKVIASDLPIGLIVGDGHDAEGRPRYEGIANGAGAALGRELEIARLLSALKRNCVANVVWLTADVHYTAALHYHPDRAVFRDFLPFWEFVSGPLHAGTFGPNALDETFGPEVIFQKHPPAGRLNLSPAEGLQFFGEVDIDGRSQNLTVTLRDLEGAALFRQVLEPGGCA
jgi:alkaline phosphatase D